ncbi:MAG: group II intron reverse transcriptase/maturase [Candidatus Marinimicrobia bacterium]|nr:group II intron reverse transcriptase/maturase [Candidatus Neomarinimicrobiota bacterium]
MSKAKPFMISKYVVQRAYESVKANKGSAGADGESIKEFEENLKDNLYKIWNRMSSGTYFPPPVRGVEIPKSNGGKRLLGIPTVSDRIAQTVVKMYLEPELDPCFHPDSYGYRPGKAMKEALGTARKRCWTYDWVIDMDIKGFFDNMDHELVMKALRKHTSSKWILLYVERWLKAPMIQRDGTQVERTKGTPQGGVISPLLANLFLHYGFDMWMRRNHPSIPFERYADDVVCHCRSEDQAKGLWRELKGRFSECGLELHPEKTKIVYCKDDGRRGNYPNESFDFLGYTFRARGSKNRWGKYFVNFSPAVSNQATKRIRQTIRGWSLHRRSDKSLDDLARRFNPMIRGWINYYSRFYKSALYPTLGHLNRILARWAGRKYKRLGRHRRRAMHWLGRIATRQPALFAHWHLVPPGVGR